MSRDKRTKLPKSGQENQALMFCKSKTLPLNETAEAGSAVCDANSFGGAGRDRTDDLKLAKLPLSQLSYSPSPK